MSNAKAKRKSIAKSVRFEVFKRDGFKCQYCGQLSPDVILHVDHINPVSKGGDNDIMNLVTSCVDCNLGKGARELDDDAAVTKQRAQLEELNERREQLEMMIQWRDSMKEMDSDVVDLVAPEIEEQIPGHEVNETGRKKIKSWIKKYGFKKVTNALETAAEKHLNGPEVTNDDASKFFDAIPKICYVDQLPKDKRLVYYVRGIVRNRMYCNERAFFPIVNAALDAGMDIEDIVELAKTAKNWTEFRTELEGVAE